MTLFHLDCAKALLAVHNVEINVQNKLGDTPLHNAAWKGHAEVVAALLEKGIPLIQFKVLACIISRPPEVWPPLYQSNLNSHASNAQLLPSLYWQ